MEKQFQNLKIDFDDWSVREKLSLASAVVRYGQNWQSISLTLKAFAEPNRPSDWFSKENCAEQYKLLVKRFGAKTPVERIVHALTEEHKRNLRKIMQEERREYVKLEKEMALIRSGKVTKEMLATWSAEMAEEEKKEEQEAIAYEQWLKQREERKLEARRSSLPIAKENKSITGMNDTVSKVLNATNKSKLEQKTSHSTLTTTCLLNTSADVSGSSSLQQLVSTTTNQEPVAASMSPLAPLTKPLTSGQIPTPTTFDTMYSLKNTLEETVPEKKYMAHHIKLNSKKHKHPRTEEENILFKALHSLSETPASSSTSIPNSPASETVLHDNDPAYKIWKKSIMLVYNNIASHRYASFFLKPVTEEQAPGYHNIVYRPMDLQTIRKNIERGVIRTTVEFQRDIMLMFTNALMYNKRNGPEYNMARQMQTDALEQIQNLQAVHAPLDPKKSKIRSRDKTKAKNKK